MRPVPEARAGRPPTTSREELQRIALGLFAARGFEETTLDDIAAAVGVSRRTVFRYYPSKNDIVWGAFDEQLTRLRAHLEAADPATPLMDVVREAVVAFNDYGPDAIPELRIRMALITGVPALQGHAMLRYREWSEVIAQFAAQRLGGDASDRTPQAIAGAALGVAMATYRHWIEHEDADLIAELDGAFRALAEGFGGA
ncbi:unannotated protein [freshwater metagenome]|uniref:Unannotated protein n=1 Tax=freshwater metagenome TaxID=449393 RepID=A0A6J7D452_9ZZZZ